MTVVPIRIQITSDEAVKGKEAVVKSLSEIRDAASNTNNSIKKVTSSNSELTGSFERLSTRTKNAQERLRDLALSGLQNTDRFKRLQSAIERNNEALKKADSATSKAADSMDILKKATAALGGIAIVHKITSLSNAFTDLKNRVILSTNSTQGAEVSLDRLFDIAIKTRSPIEALTALYQKGSLASKELGASQEDLFKFTELVGKALAIQGGSAQTANGALLQLSQALGTGTIKAEEFNSILEGAFPIAQAAARGIERAGGSVAKLRQLIVTGQVSSKEFFKGLLSQSDELDKNFKKMTPSIAGAGIVLENNVLKIMGKLEPVFGIIASLILVFANNLETLLKIATAVGIGLLVAFSPAILGAAITLIDVAVTALIAKMRLLTLVIAANPIGAFVVLITSAVAALVLFSDKIKLSSDGVATLADLIDVFVAEVKVAMSQLSDFFADVFGPLIKLVEKTFGKMEISISGILKFTANIIDRYIGIWRGAYLSIVAIFENLPAAFKDIFIRALNGAIGIVETGINKIAMKLNSLPGIDVPGVNFGRFKNNNEGGASRLGRAVSNAFSKGYNQDTIADNVDRALDRAEKRARDRLKNAKGEDAANTILNGGTSAINKAMNDNKIKDKIDKALKNKNTKFAANDNFDNLGEIKSDLDGIEFEINEFGKAFESVMQRSEDSLVDFVRTGSMNFSDLINGMLDDLARLAIRENVTKPLGNAISNISGNLFTSMIGSSASSGVFEGMSLSGNSTAFTGPSGSTTGTYVSGSGMTGFDQGVNYVPRDMVAQLHRGERVVTAAENRNGGDNQRPITVNLMMPNVTDFQSFRQNQAQASALVARSLGESARRNN